MRISLKTKLTFAFAFLALIPLLLMGFLSLYVINYTHTQDVVTMENQLLNQKSAEISKFLDDTAGQFEIKVGYNSSSVISDRDQKFLLEGLLQNQNILEVSFADMSGQERQKISNIQDATLMPLFDVSSLDAFKKAKAGLVYYGPVEQTLSGPVMTLAGPVTSEGGDVIMVLLGKIALKPLTQIVSYATLGNSGYLYVSDLSGNIIASAQAKYLGTSSKIAKDQINFSKNDQIGLGGQEVLVSSTLMPKQSWRLVAEWPKNDAFLVVNEVRNQVFYLTFAALVIVLFLGWLVGRRILKPLKILQTGAEKIGEGNFDLKLKIETGDELQNFAQVLNNSAVALKRLKELREEFVFIASHELRTPVTAMKGYLSMVLGGEAGVISPDAKKMLEQVTLANQRLVQLVEDLLEVARSDAGRLTINTQKIEMSPIVQNVLKELMPLAKEKNIQLVYAPSLEAQVLADPERLKEVLVNLVGNAIKYTVGSGTVTINHQLKGKELITSVSDTGIGMTASEQQKLFEKFYRIKNTDTQKISGTGLGLFIVKQIVEKMNGKIWVVSEKGKGSTFSFSLKIK